MLVVLEGKAGKDFKIYEKREQPPRCPTEWPEDFSSARMPAPTTTPQLAKYDLKMTRAELIDEIECYIFQVRPKGVDRAHAYFEGIVWVDEVYIDVVKTYGKWINDLGDMRSATMPFSIYETYRENVDGKFWIPNYMRSDGTLNLKDQNVPVRLVVKWTDFKPVSAAAPAPAAAPPAAAPKPLS